MRRLQLRGISSQDVGGYKHEWESVEEAVSRLRQILRELYEAENDASGDESSEDDAQEAFPLGGGGHHNDEDDGDESGGAAALVKSELGFSC